MCEAEQNGQRYGHVRGRTERAAIWTPAARGEHVERVGVELEREQVTRRQPEGVRVEQAPPLVVHNDVPTLPHEPRNAAGHAQARDHVHELQERRLALTYHHVVHRGLGHYLGRQDARVRPAHHHCDARAVLLDLSGDGERVGVRLRERRDADDLRFEALERERDPARVIAADIEVQDLDVMRSRPRMPREIGNAEGRRDLRVRAHA